MREGGRLAAAIAVLDEIVGAGVPARLALKGWGDRARYAGAKDRAFVSGLVLDALRRRRSLSWSMDAQTARALVLGVGRLLWSWPAERIEAAADETHGPGPLTAHEREHVLGPRSLDGAPPAVRGDYPDWAEPMMERAFGERRVAQGEALAARAPVDLRINTLVANRDKVGRALAPFHPEPVGPLAESLRIPPPAASERAAAIESTTAFEKGWFEVQDLGSQIAAACAGELIGAQVLDFCAGAGGKTLALAARMENSGQIFAYDRQARRLAMTVRRARRAKVRNLQVIEPSDAGALGRLRGRMDLVFVDAPCTGSGTWRRHPDAKWRLRPAQLEQRITDENAALGAAAAYVAPGGRLLYVTCSVFAEENEDRIAAFLGAHEHFRPAAIGRIAEHFGPGESTLRLTPATTQTDGFFIAALRRDP